MEQLKQCRLLFNLFQSCTREDMKSVTMELSIYDFNV
jgi:hypothetical protein